MNIFELHKSIIEDYKSYIDSFINIKDQKVKEAVDEELKAGRFLKEPLIQFNPSYSLGESIAHLTVQNLTHPSLSKVFGDYNLDHHQAEALKKGINGESFIVTSGTGSGKSLTFFGTIFDFLFKQGESVGEKRYLNPSHGIAILRHCGIHVNIAGAHSPNTSIFTNWEEFYQWFQNYVASHPDAKFHLIGCGDGYNLDAPFRIEWFGGGVSPIEHRNTCILSRWASRIRHLC